MDTKAKIIFMGTPEFGTIILEGIIKDGLKPLLVITASDKPVGRKQIITPPPVKSLIIEHKTWNIPILQPEKISNIKSEISNLKPDMIVAAAYSQIIPKEILEIPKYGCLNIHPSLLPKYRGPSPIQSAILNGDERTGVTIFLIDEKLDHGPILSQKSIKIEGKETAKTLHDKLANFGADLLLETIFKWRKGLIRPKPQNEVEATFSKILVKDDGRINWEKTSEELEREVRAFEIWPGSFTFWEKKSQLLRIKILKARVFNKTSHSLSYSIGKTLVVPQNEIGVQCGKDFLVIEKLKLEGKKETLSDDFIRGYPDFIGTILK
jgi:methionyl-tRNA formyltransferase